ncbi:MAG: hypothetical protein LBI73_09630 [Myroides sp.]|jgi:hypothetical protein|nr:hypothetical protein [Myroides sp.]
MSLFNRIYVIVLFMGISCTYAGERISDSYSHIGYIASNDLQRSVELILAQVDLDNYYQYVDFDNVALKESPLATPGIVYLIPFQTSATSDWSICLAILNDSEEVVISGIAMNTWKYNKAITHYPIIEYEKPYLYSKEVQLNIVIDLLKTGEVNNAEIISHEKIIFVPNKAQTKLNKILQFEYNAVVKRDDDRGDSYTFSVNNNDKLIIDNLPNTQFQNITLSRERNTSISLLPQLKQKCTTASKSSSAFLIKEQKEGSFTTSYFIQQFTEEYIYYTDEEQYKKLSSAIPVTNVLGLYEKCVIASK